MKNTVVLSGRLPGFEGKYTPANGDKKSRMNWAMNVQLSSKNEQGYYDEGLINFTAWGWYADMLEQVNKMDKESKKEYTNITITGRMNAGYKDKEGNIVNQVSLDVAEFEFTRRLQMNTATAGEKSYAPAGATPMGTPKAPAGRTPMAPAGRPSSMPGIPPMGNRQAGGPRF